MGAVDNFRSWTRRQGAPITVGVVAALVVAALALAAARSADVVSLLAFDADWLRQPWSILTYPLLSFPLVSAGSLVFFIIFLMWLFWIGSSLEREAGTRTYTILLVVMTVMPAILIWAGDLLFQSRWTFLAGPILPEAGLTVAWGTRNPRAVVMLWGILPIPGIWIAILAALGILINFGAASIPAGIFACGHLVVAWAYGTGRISLNFGGGKGVGGTPFHRNVKEVHATRAQARYDESYYEEVRKREKEREEQKRLKRLLGEADEEP